MLVIEGGCCVASSGFTKIQAIKLENIIRGSAAGAITVGRTLREVARQYDLTTFDYPEFLTIVSNGLYTAAYAAPAAGMQVLETRYDAARRGILTIKPPDRNGVVTSATVEYLPLGKKLTDENGISKTFYNISKNRAICEPY